VIMKNKKNTTVGLFVLAGALFLVFSLYLIGRNQYLFNSPFTLYAVAKNVNGLVPGNAVRFLGMDVGIVKSIEVANDTEIYIAMQIDNGIKPYIKKNAVISIGTDGLMGNKLIEIKPQVGDSDAVNDGDFIQSVTTVDTDELIKRLDSTSFFIAKFSANLYEITEKLNDENSLWTLLSDTTFTRDLSGSVAALHRAGSNSAELTETAKDMFQKLEQGNGIVSRVFMDTILSQQLSVSLSQMEQTTNNTLLIMNDLKKITASIRLGEGTAGLLLSDTLLRSHIAKSTLYLEQGTNSFQQNMEALKSSFLFRKYFRKLEKNSKNKDNVIGEKQF
jgi:phospholipid/cholesterol/gamma-HCH transport system substrate-binding protein